MRLMVRVQLDTEIGNQLITSGKIADVIGRIVGDLKPEVVYFHPEGGRRAVTMVVDVPDASYTVSIAEPFWNELNATVETFPCMNLDELQAGLGRLT